MREFRDQTIYFIVTDRFCDGDPGNDVGKDAASYDASRTQWYMYWGGDLLGVIRKLDYLQGMGITALWLTPVFDQVDMVVKLGVPMASYHGYWTKDFKRIDEHLVEQREHVRVFAGNDTLFDQLLAELHRRGMQLILDVVCNHSNPKDAGGRGELYDDGRKLASYDEDKGRWYHHAGEVTDWRNLEEIQSRGFAGLADFDEESYAFRCYIKEAIKLWLDKGVDALRVDTVKHMPLWFWQEFTGDILKHRPTTFMFGEWFLGGARDADAVRFEHHSGMTLIDFDLHFAIKDVLAKGHPFSSLEEVFQQDVHFKSASELVTFVDNHDLPRFLSVRDDRQRLRMAVDLVMTARGIPCIYYGTEQYLHNDTGGGEDPYNRPMMERWDSSTPIYQDLRKLTQLRRENVAIQRGGMHTRYLSEHVYVFERVYMGNCCLVALNKGPFAQIPTFGLGLPDGEYIGVLGGETLRVAQGQATLSLPTDAVQVFSLTRPAVQGPAVVTLQVNGAPAHPRDQVYVTGDCPELGAWDLLRALKLEYINPATFSLDVAFTESIGQVIRYKYLVMDLVMDGKGRIQRQEGLGHYRIVPKSGRFGWRTNW